MSRRLRRGRVAAAAAVVVAVTLVLGGIALSRSSAFHAETLRVEGASFRTDAEVLARAGLDRATNVIYLDRSAATAALREDPWIADAWIETDLPSTIVVHVRERSPIAAADGQGVSADGVWLPGADVEGLPLLRAFDGSLDPASAAAAAAALVDLPGSWRRQVETALLFPDATIRF
ncbi:MAG TPA: FtsQ-type POTRA domain-containing protein, partial [Actinomycetota bacterium]